MIACVGTPMGRDGGRLTIGMHGTPPGQSNPLPQKASVQETSRASSVVPIGSAIAVAPTKVRTRARLLKMEENMGFCAD